jgi:hypothetical protein
MQRSEIKKLLIDLDLTVAEIGALAVGYRGGPISRAAVWKYFDGKLTNPFTLASIWAVIEDRARTLGVTLPAEIAGPREREKKHPSNLPARRRAPTQHQTWESTHR